MHRPALRTVALVLLETVVILLTVALAAWLRLGHLALEVFVFDDGVYKALVITLVTQSCLYFADLYNLRYTVDRRDFFVRIIQALAAASFMLAVIYFWFPNLTIGRGVFLIAAILVIGAVIGWRLL